MSNVSHTLPPVLFKCGVGNTSLDDMALVGVVMGTGSLGEAVVCEGSLLLVVMGAE